MTKPLVTVLIDTYNYSEFIGDAIESVINQSFPSQEIEILVIDDGSTDNTKNIIDKYKNKIRYIYKNNGGQASALNVGFNEANGRYIVLLDSDDFCEPNRIERVVEEFEKDKDVGCVMNSRRILENGTHKYEKRPNFFNSKLNYENLDIYIDASYGTSRTSLKKSVLKNILPLPEKGLKIEADLYLNLLLYLITNVTCINEYLTIYRIHGDNLYCLTDIKKMPLQVSCMKCAIDELKKKINFLGMSDDKVIRKLTEPYEIDIQQRMLEMSIINRSASRRDVVYLELKKLQVNWDKYSVAYKLYTIIKIPFLGLLSPKLFLFLKNNYERNKLYRFRKQIFPE